MKIVHHCHPPLCFLSQRLGSLANVYSIMPPEGSQWDCSQENTTCVYMPNYQSVMVLLKSHHTVMDVLAETCRVRSVHSKRKINVVFRLITLIYHHTHFDFFESHTDILLWLYTLLLYLMLWVTL